MVILKGKPTKQGSGYWIRVPKDLIDCQVLDPNTEYEFALIPKTSKIEQIASQQPSLLDSKVGSLRGGKPASTTDEDGGTIQSHTQYMKERCFINAVDPQGQLAAALGTRFYEPAEEEE